MNRDNPDNDLSQAPTAGPQQWEAAYRQHAWDYLAGLSEAPRYAAVAGYVHRLVPRGHILDAGCGEGILRDYLDANRFQYTGFDLSPTAIDRARERNRTGTMFCCALADFIPIPGDSYDVIIFNEVLTTLERPAEILDRFYRFLRPAGHIIVSQYQHPDPASNAVVFTRTFENDLTAGRYPLVAKWEVLNCGTGARWRVYCLGS